ncbi:MAG: hypothetical protein ABI603_15950 [Acidobacteriota bacterium]
MTLPLTSFGASQGQPPSSAFDSWAVGVILAAAVGVPLGLLWDISWHMSVGRDTILTPPHGMFYGGAMVAGLMSGIVVLRTTFGDSVESRARSVRFWGFRGPLGAWIAIWGSFAMLASAPFDNWWHAAYGLDVKVITPPHMLLAIGLLSIVIGALTLMAAVQNRSTDSHQTGRIAWAYVTAGGALALGFADSSIEASFPNAQHTAEYYQFWALALPGLLIGLSRAGRTKWAATASAGVFMVLWFGMGLILRHVDATPRLAPIYNPRTYMWPPFFPTLLIVPAFGIDLLRQRFRELDSWRVALTVGATFVVLLVAVQWPFSRFMLTPAAENWFFNANEWAYTARPGAARHAFWKGDHLLSGLVLAIVIATGSARLGLAWGGWMSRVKR